MHPLSTRKQPQTSGDKKEVFENKLEVLKNWHKSQAKRVSIAKNFLVLLRRKEFFEKGETTKCSIRERKKPDR